MHVRNIQIMRKSKPVDVAFLDCQNPDPAVLAYLLEHLPKKADDQEFLSIPKGETYFPFADDTTLKLTTTHKLILRKSKKHHDQWRLSVIESVSFGERSQFSNVCVNPKTFRYKGDQVVTTTKPRLYKQLTQNYDRKFDETYRYCDSRVATTIALEQEILAALPYLKVSKMYHVHSEYFLTYAHFESLLPGVSFRQYVVGEVGKPLMVEALSMPERIQLSMALIEAVVRVTSQGIIHADVKPANLIVSHIDGKFEAKLIDVNLSKLASDRTPNLVAIGSPLYLAPEALDTRVLDVKSDVFSLGIVIAQCFGASLAHFTKVDQIIESLYKPYEFKELFVGVKDATLEQRMIISSLLKLMVEHNLAKRLSISEAAEAFKALTQIHAPASLQNEGAPLAPLSGLQIPETLFGQPKIPSETSTVQDKAFRSNNTM